MYIKLSSLVQKEFGVMSLLSIIMNLLFVLLTGEVLLLGFTLAQQPCRAFERATDNLREVVIGACEIYQQDINQPVFCPNKFRNCTEIWEAFIEAFRHQPRCNVSDSRLDRYINLTDHPLPPNKSMFWENVYPFVHRFTNKGQRYTALSDTLTGYAGNGPQWCSDPDTDTGMSPPGTNCPGWEATPDCPQSAQRAFWVAASRSFGKRANGEIFIMLNATTQPIYANDTYLAEYELPYLRENVVTKATVLLINEQSVHGKTKCDDPSLRSLSELMASKHINYFCVENRRDLVTAFCMDYPYSQLCSVAEQQTSRSVTYTIKSNVLVVLCLLSIIMFLLLYSNLRNVLTTGHHNFTNRKI